MHPEHICERLAPTQFVGIALAKTGHGNMHTGITYQWRGNLYLYHQAFQVDTKLERFEAAVAGLGGITLVVALPFRRDRLKAVAGFLDSIGKNNPQHPYSLKYDPKAVIDKDLGVLVTSEGKGLSCVTFVLAVFQTFQIRLVDGSTWPTNRPEDLVAQQQLIDLLNKSARATEAHKQAVAAEKGCVRIRPEEASGSGLYKVVPVRFADAEPAGVYLLGEIARRSPSGAAATSPPV